MCDGEHSSIRSTDSSSGSPQDEASHTSRNVSLIRASNSQGSRGVTRGAKLQMCGRYPCDTPSDRSDGFGRCERKHLRLLHPALRIGRLRTPIGG
jgi:hypothetical protein